MFQVYTEPPSGHSNIRTQIKVHNHTELHQLVTEIVISLIVYQLLPFI